MDVRRDVITRDIEPGGCPRDWSEAEVAAERAEDGVLLALLYLDQWRAVWRAGKVVDLLEAAATGEAVAVWAVVSAVTVGARAGP